MLKRLVATWLKIDFKLILSEQFYFSNRKLRNNKITKKCIRIQVGAFDKGTPPRQSSTATVLLTVADVNDNAPRFARLYTLNITENVAVGTDLLYVATVDKDGPGNSNVTYEFVDNPGKDPSIRLLALLNTSK